MLIKIHLTQVRIYATGFCLTGNYFFKLWLSLFLIVFTEGLSVQLTILISSKPFLEKESHIVNQNALDKDVTVY